MKSSSRENLIWFTREMKPSELESRIGPIGEELVREIGSSPILVTSFEYLPKDTPALLVLYERPQGHTLFLRDQEFRMFREKIAIPLADGNLEYPFLGVLSYLSGCVSELVIMRLPSVLLSHEQPAPTTLEQGAHSS